MIVQQYVKKNTPTYKKLCVATCIIRFICDSGEDNDLRVDFINVVFLMVSNS